MKKLLSILFISLFLPGIAYAGSETMTLITDAEGAMKEAPPGLYEVGRVINNGPDIKLVEPASDGDIKPPIKVAILFVPVDGNEIDLSKLKVEYLKMFTIDLTDRVLPYTTKQGITIDNAELPSGKHKLRVTVGDIKGGITQEIFIVKLQ